MDNFKNDTNYLDQHFLIDEDVIKVFIDSCDLNKNDKVLEIGAGKGTLSKIINSKIKSLTIIEKDERLKKYLSKYNVIYNDVLKEDISGYNKIITSLPYSITEPFIYKLIDVSFDKLIMICGKTFADNTIFKNDSKLSILTNLYFNVEKIIDIKPDSFEPKPRVLSSLIVLTKKDINELSKEDKIIRMLYKYRYLKVKNALKEILIKLDNITQKEARAIINSYNIDENILNKLFDELSNNEVKVLKNKIKPSKI